MSVSDLIRVIDGVHHDGTRDHAEWNVRLALDYLLARIPADTHARPALLTLIDSLAAYGRANIHGGTTVTEQGDYSSVSLAASRLKDAVQFAAEAYTIVHIRDHSEMPAMAAALGVRADWHEPDEQGVHAQVTGGGFDNSGHVTLEQMVIIYLEGMPAYQVNLATLLSWACATARADT